MITHLFQFNWTGALLALHRWCVCVRGENMPLDGTCCRRVQLLGAVQSTTPNECRSLLWTLSFFGVFLFAGRRLLFFWFLNQAIFKVLAEWLEVFLEIINLHQVFELEWHLQIIFGMFLFAMGPNIFQVQGDSAVVALDFGC